MMVLLARLDNEMVLSLLLLADLLAQARLKSEYVMIVLFAPLDAEMVLKRRSVSYPSAAISCRTWAGLATTALALVRLWSPVASCFLSGVY